MVLSCSLTVMWIFAATCPLAGVIERGAGMGIPSGWQLLGSAPRLGGRQNCHSATITHVLL